MAQLRVFQSIKNNRWTLLFKNETDILSDSDKALIAKFGEPQINVGGTYLGSTANTFTLPDDYVKLFSGFPYTRVFDASTTPFSTNTQTKVEGYRDAIVAAVTAALTTLRNNTDTFTSEKIYDNL